MGEHPFNGKERNLIKQLKMQTLWQIYGATVSISELSIELHYFVASSLVMQKDCVINYT